MAERPTARRRSVVPLRLEAELERRRGPRRIAQRDAGELELCPCCGRDLVFPVDWAPAGPQHWHVTLRCPECEWQGAGVFSQRVVDRFDEVLDRGTQAVLEDLELLARANMQDQVDAFAAALERDLILPEDF